jgi:hypothetical protein
MAAHTGVSGVHDIIRKGTEAEKKLEKCGVSAMATVLLLKY